MNKLQLIKCHFGHYGFEGVQNGVDLWSAKSVFFAFVTGDGNARRKWLEKF